MQMDATHHMIMSVEVNSRFLHKSASPERPDVYAWQMAVMQLHTFPFDLF